MRGWTWSARTPSTTSCAPWIFSCPATAGLQREVGERSSGHHRHRIEAVMTVDSWMVARNPRMRRRDPYERVGQDELDLGGEAPRAARQVDLLRGQRGDPLHPALRARG